MFVVEAYVALIRIDCCLKVDGSMVLAVLCPGKSGHNLMLQKQWLGHGNTTVVVVAMKDPSNSGRTDVGCQFIGELLEQFSAVLFHVLDDVASILGCSLGWAPRSGKIFGVASFTVPMNNFLCHVVWDVFHSCSFCNGLVPKSTSN